MIDNFVQDRTGPQHTRRRPLSPIPASPAASLRIRKAPTAPLSSLPRRRCCCHPWVSPPSHKPWFLVARGWLVAVWLYTFWRSSQVGEISRQLLLFLLGWLVPGIYRSQVGHSFLALSHLLLLVLLCCCRLVSRVSRYRLRRLL